MADLVFELFGEIPPKKNSKRMLKSPKTGKMFPVSSERYLAWEKASCMEMHRQMAHNQGFRLPLEYVDKIVVHLYYGTRRIKDNTNTVESIHDLLVKVGVLVDDNWRRLPDTRQIAHYRKNDAGCKIILTVND